MQGPLFFAVQFTQLQSSYRISMLTHAHSMHDPTFNIVPLRGFSIAQISVALSAVVASVEDVFFTSSVSTPAPGSLGDLVPWRAFFVHFRNVKILRVHHRLGMEIADILRRGDGQPTIDAPPAPEEADLDHDATTPSVAPNGSSQYALDVLPSLEEIEVYVGAPGTLTTSGESEVPSELGVFEPVVTARQQMGRPVKVNWSTGRVPPRYFRADFGAPGANPDTLPPRARPC